MHMELVFKQQNNENTVEIRFFFPCICFLIVKIYIQYLFLKEKMTMF